MSYTPSPSPPATPPTSDSECESVTFSNIFQFPSGTYLVSTPPHPHPFAASARANRAPPAYEKKPFTPPTTPPNTKKATYPCGEQTRNSDVEVEVESSSVQHLPSLVDEEQKRWDLAISSAVDKAETKLDLSNSGLTYIPSSIIDLKGLVVLARSQRTTTNTTRTFMRSMTAPTVLPSSNTRPFLPSHTTNRLGFKASGQRLEGVRKPAVDRNGCEMELYLMRNALRMLPRELFALDCLVVLSLRQNKLTSLPPAICKLTRLRELNIANNRLSHLPAEIQDLHLASLLLHPNPFITPPPPPRDQQIHGTRVTRTLGPLKCGSSVPTLSELTLRCLLSPATATALRTSSRSKSCLEESMSLAEIDALVLPMHIKRTLRASTGHDRARLTEEGGSVDAELDVTMNICPCPRHYSLGRSIISSKKSVRFVPNGHQTKRGLFDHNAPVFRMPVVERMEWVGTVAGVQVAESRNAWVPLLWRGCRANCLDFLEDGEDEEMSDDTFKAGKGNEQDEFQFSDDE